MGTAALSSEVRLEKYCLDFSDSRNWPMTEISLGLCPFARREFGAHLGVLFGKQFATSTSKLFLWPEKYFVAVLCKTNFLLSPFLYTLLFPCFVFAWHSHFLTITSTLWSLIVKSISGVCVKQNYVLTLFHKEYLMLFKHSKRLSCARSFPNVLTGNALLYETILDVRSLKYAFILPNLMFLKLSFPFLGRAFLFWVSQQFDAFFYLLNNLFAVPVMLPWSHR